MNMKQSLRTLRADLHQKETMFKAIQNHYPHLAHFTEEEILKYLQIDTIEELREHMKQTLDTSVALYKDQIEEMICSCKDSEGSFKDPYDTQEVAQHKADELMMHQELKLRVYPCPYGNGWHLTKG